MGLNCIPNFTNGDDNVSLGNNAGNNKTDSDNDYPRWASTSATILGVTPTDNFASGFAFGQSHQW